MSLTGQERRIHMTMNSTVTTSAAPTPYSVNKTVESLRTSAYDRRKASLETQIFDLWAKGDSLRIECGPTTFDIEISEETTGIGKREVVARITDLTSGITRTSSGKATGAVQYQSIGWYVNLADIDQVCEVLSDPHNPANLKAVIRHMLQGNLRDVGDPYSRRQFNGVRLKVLSARRRNDRDVIRSI